MAKRYSKKRRTDALDITRRKYAARKRRAGQNLQKKFDRLAGPVTVRKIGDPKPDDES